MVRSCKTLSILWSHGLTPTLGLSLKKGECVLLSPFFFTNVPVECQRKPYESTFKSDINYVCGIKKITTTHPPNLRVLLEVLGIFIGFGLTSLRE